jgi:hypothetical protein
VDLVVEWRGAAPSSHADKVDRGGGGMESRRWQMVEKSRTYMAHTLRSPPLPPDALGVGPGQAGLIGLAPGRHGLI